MKNEKTDQQVLSIVIKDDGHFNASRTKESYFVNNHRDLYDYLNCRFDDLTCSDNFSEILYRLKNSLETAPICPVCGSQIPYTGKYLLVCSDTCKKSKMYRQIVHLKQVDGCIKKYGVENPFQSETIKFKIKQTFLEKYGEDHPNKCKWQKEKGTLKYIETYKHNSDEIIQKRKDTCLELYGDENYRNIQKTQQTNIKKYNVTNTYQCQECKNLIKKKYGVTNVFQNEEIKEKIKNTKLARYGNPYYSNREKAKQTSIMTYGTEYPMQSQEICDKSFNVKVQNGTIGTSMIEKDVLDELKNKFQNVKYQYKDKLYPFMCDYYLPDYQLYIELQGNWTHGHHPYNPNDKNDIDIINKWKTKSNEINSYGKKKDYYDGAIKTWTISDPLKRKIAKENKLNYLEIFSCDKNKIMKQIYEFIKNIEQ